MTDQETPGTRAPNDRNADNNSSGPVGRAVGSAIGFLSDDGGILSRIAKDILTILTIILVGLTVVLGIKVYLFPSGDGFSVSASAILAPAPTNIVATAGSHVSGAPDARYWRVSGAVTDDGEVAKGSYVLVTLEDENGHKFVEEYDSEDGKFEVMIMQAYDRNLSKAPHVKLVKIYARQKGIWGILSGGTATTLKMDASVSLSPDTIHVATRPFIFVLGLFIFTALVTIVRLRQGFWNRVKYYVLINLGLLFTVSMIYLIGVTITSLVGADGPKQKATSIGFGYVFFNSYVVDGPKDWNFSLTRPHRITAPGSNEGQADSVTAASAPQPASGFGAPLWVLLLSVLGAGLYTIKLVVDNVRKGSSYSEQAVRAMAADILQHQFYILFAPLGSIFVYQFLILTGVGSKSLTVALAALASGIALNVLLKKAWDSVAEILQTDQTPPEDKSLDSKVDAGSGEPVAPQEVGGTAAPPERAGTQS